MSIQQICFVVCVWFRWVIWIIIIIICNNTAWLKARGDNLWLGWTCFHSFLLYFFCKMLVNIYNILANFLLIEIKKKFDDFCWVLHFCLYFIFASTFILVRCNLSGESFQTNSQCPPVEVSLSVCISALLFWLHWNTHTIFSQLG